MSSSSSSGRKRPRASASASSATAVDGDPYQKLCALVKKATTSGGSHDNDDDDNDDEKVIDKACWAELKRALRGASDGGVDVAGHALTALLGQLRDRRPQVGGWVGSKREAEEGAGSALCLKGGVYD